MGSLSYFDIALRTYRGLGTMLEAATEIDWFNPFSVECHQVVEKMLKELIKLIASPTENIQSLLMTHDLIFLARRLNSKYPNYVKVQDCSWLSDFYFNTMYLGENFFAVSEDEARDLLNATTEIVETLIGLHKDIVKQLTSYFD